MTFFPSARLASTATVAESMPPEIPTTAPEAEAALTFSFMKSTIFDSGRRPKFFIFAAPPASLR
jgi:hypothetical protein